MMSAAIRAADAAEMEMLQLQIKFLEAQKLLHKEKADHAGIKMKNVEAQWKLEESEKLVEKMKEDRETILRDTQAEKEELSGILAAEKLKVQKLMKEKAKHEAKIDNMEQNCNIQKKKGVEKDRIIKILTTEVERVKLDNENKEKYGAPDSYYSEYPISYATQRFYNRRH